ncbi:DnaJ domain-containing protein [Artemisia annua]|uniref:DnaJ domain-containing protein n=1 Tax=Artemisia annua TaxID=35608 RepID=A0A2U1LMR8_ARTAN|nr:DnaJ domain-containing protein [Artemisia annua]
MTAATTTTDDFEEEAPLSKWESLHLKTLAEQSYTNKDLESALKYTKRAHRLNPSLNNLSDMLTAYNILVTASATLIL